MARIKTTGLRIILYPDPILRRVCDPIETVNGDIRKLAEQMLSLMHQARGVGLASSQVGVPVRLFVCNPSGNEGDDRVYINPRLSVCAGAEEHEEGCLSIPNVTVTMRRATRVVLEALDLNSDSVRREATNLEARIFQHEIDHLNGRLILDAMSATDEIANRRAVRKLESDYSAIKRS